MKVDLELNDIYDLERSYGLDKIFAYLLGQFRVDYCLNAFENAMTETCRPDEIKMAKEMMNEIIKKEFDV